MYICLNEHVSERYTNFFFEKNIKSRVQLKKLDKYIEFSFFLTNLVWVLKARRIFTFSCFHFYFHFFFFWCNATTTTTTKIEKKNKPHRKKKNLVEFFFFLFFHSKDLKIFEVKDKERIKKKNIRQEIKSYLTVARCFTL